MLSLIGLLSGLLASLNQLLRLWESKAEANREDKIKSLKAELEVLEAGIKSIREALEALESEKDS